MVLNPEPFLTNFTLKRPQLFMNVLVFPQRLRRRKRLPTSLTHRSRFRRGVHVPVPAQRRRTVEPGRANLAAVSFFVRMNPQVGLHVRLGGEIFRANFTQKRPQPLVLDLVPHQRLPRGKHLVALVAGQVKVDRDVVSEAALASEPRRTFWAGERLLFGVDHLVHFKRSGIGERFWTQVAQEGSLSGVGSQVVLEDEAATEGLWTFWALVAFGFLFGPWFSWFGNFFVVLQNFHRQLHCRDFVVTITRQLIFTLQLVLNFQFRS